MTKIRVHELARELGRENKEIMAVLQKNGVEVKSHMSNVEEKDAARVRAAIGGRPAKMKEDEHMQKDTDAANKAETKTEAKAETKAETREGAQPKKKNIIQVFRPQNSKTGMVKPGGRPRPQGTSAGRPKPGARNAQGQSSARPQSSAAAQGTDTQAKNMAAQQASMAAETAAQKKKEKETAAPQAVKSAEQPAKAPEAAPQAKTQETKNAETAAKTETTQTPQSSAQNGQGASQGSQTQPQGTVQSIQSQSSQGTAQGSQGRPQSTAQSGQGRAQGRPQGTAQSGQGRPQGAVQGSQSRSQGGQRNQGSFQGSQGGPRSGGYQGSQGGPRSGGYQGGQGGPRSGSYQGGQGGQRSGSYQGGQGGPRSGSYQGGQGGPRSGGYQGGQGGPRSGGYQGGQGGPRSGGYQGGQGGPRSGGYQGSQGGQRSGGYQGNQGGQRSGGYQGGQGGPRSGGYQGGQGGQRSGGFQGRPGGQGRPQGDRYQGSQGGRGVAIPKAPTESKPLEKESRKRTERGDRNRVEKGEKLDRLEKNVRPGQKGAKKGQAPETVAPQPVEKPEDTIRTITIPEKLTIMELGEAMKIQPAAIVKKLFLQGTMVTVNQEVDFEKAEEIALEFNCICEKEVKVNVLEELLKEDEDAEENMIPRSPVVCVMGHVDHGKTSLLDAIRNTHVIDKEAGGITQHIGAYVVSVNGQKITFLDTPGHEAFTAMRMRGANATDIAILVVAADDGVMPQTIEAINHAKAAGIEIIVAINKIDKPSANVERVKQELSEYELIPEDWGGSTVFVPVSAHTQEGIDTLLEMILLTAEVAELKANPNRKARGLVIEAELDKGKGPVATVLVQKGTLHVGDPVAAGSCHGKVRAMMDDKGRRVKEAGPSTPVEILGFDDVPNAGEIFMAMETEKEARSFAETFISEGRERLLEDTKARMSLDDLFTQIQAGNLKELDIIVKADVQGSVEAVKQSLLKLTNEEVVVKIIHGGVGAINESDVILASASNAIIIGFNVRPDATAKATAEHEGVDMRLYRVIYDAIADVEAAMKGMLDPVFEEKVIGHAEVRQTFKASGVGTIAGAYVTDGVFQRGCSARITRDSKVLFDGSLASLKRFKDDVKEVKAGYECGLVFEKFNDIQEEDKVEAYIMVEVPR